VVLQIVGSCAAVKKVDKIIMNQEMKIPTYLQKYVCEYTKKKNGHQTMSLSSLAGNNLFEIWYYGEWEKVGKYEYLVDTEEAPVLIVAKDPLSKDEFVVFDGAKYGYNAMFVYEYTDEQLAQRSLQKFECLLSNLVVTIGNGIDWESEKEDFIDKDGENVTLLDGRIISWEDVVVNAFDYFSLSYVDGNNQEVQFADFELA